MTRVSPSPHDDLVPNSPVRWHDIEPIYTLALMLPADERAAYLEGATAGDVDLRAEIDRLLERHPVQATGEALHRHHTSAASMPVAPPRPQPRSRIGDQLGPFWLDHELARDSRTVAYLATRVDPFHDDPDPASRRVVVRVADTPVPGDAARRLLRDRRDAPAALVHPAITRLLDAGVTPDGCPFVVTEHAVGAPITVAATQQSLELNSRLSLFLECCDAVTHAHRHFLAHGALTSQTLLVDPQRQLRVVDIGTAPLLDAAAPAPTVRDDIRALGIVLFELLTCEAYPGGTPRMRRSARNEARLWEDRLEGDLDAIVHTAVAPGDGGGYPTVEALADDLRRHAAGFPVQVRPLGLPRRMGRAAARNAPMVFAATIGAALAIAAIVVAARRGRAAEAIPAADRPREAAPAAPHAVRPLAALPDTVAPPVPESGAVTPATATPATATPATATPAAVTGAAMTPAAAAPVASAPDSAPSAAAASRPRAIAAPVSPRAVSRAAPSNRPTATTPVGNVPIGDTGARRRFIAEIAALDSLTPAQQATPAVRRRYAVAYQELARLQAAAGDRRDALSSSRRALGMRASLATAGRPDRILLRELASAMRDEGTQLASLGQVEEARRSYAPALAIADSLQRADPRDVLAGRMVADLTARLARLPARRPR
ncbi:MAG: hypothetical protein IT355_02765 [Gemmatimonadaceae bacterium]|nr:hypothetical protein [Gemmatimonadaceae bacterium]